MKHKQTNKTKRRAFPKKKNRERENRVIGTKKEYKEFNVDDDVHKQNYEMNVNKREMTVCTHLLSEIRLLFK